MERSYEYTPFNLLVNFQNNLNGVESKNSSEHFQYISISSLNTITESQRELEEVLFKYDLKLKEMVDYKL